MDITGCIRRMVASSGKSAREVSRVMGRAPTWIATAISRKTDISASRLASVARACGWRLVLKHGKDVMEVDPRADGDKGPADQC